MTSADDGKAAARPRSRGLKTLLAVVLLAAPALPAPLTPWPGAASLVMAGALPVILGGLVAGPRLAWVVAAAMTVLVPVALWLGAIPWAGAALVAALAGVAALSAVTGWHMALVMVPAQLSLLLVRPPVLGTGAGVPQPREVSYLLVGAAVAAVGACWAALIEPRLLGGTRLPRPAPISVLRARWFAVALALLCGVSAYAVLAISPGGNGAWLLMAMLTVARPELPQTLSRTAQRTIGTVVGGALAAGLAVVVPAPTVLFYLGLGFLTAGIVLATGPRYWLTIAAITPAVVFLAAPGTDLVVRDAERVVFTLLGGVLVVVTGILVGLVVRVVYRSAPPETATMAT